VDYATVYYWYQNEPDGFTHAPLDPPAERRALMRHPNLVATAGPHPSE